MPRNEASCVWLQTNYKIPHSAKPTLGMTKALYKTIIKHLFPFIPIPHVALPLFKKNYIRSSGRQLFTKKD